MKLELGLCLGVALTVFAVQEARSGPRVPTELCDAADNDGDGRIDEGFDGDGDGYMSIPQCGRIYVKGLLDCDDGDPLTHPEAFDRCGDGQDMDCSGLDCPRG